MVCLTTLFLTLSFVIGGSIGDLNSTSSSTDPSTDPSTDQAVVTTVNYGSAILYESFGRVQIVDAVVETTPDICPSFVICAFQVYDKSTLEVSEPYIRFCDCPEGEVCTYHSQNWGQHFYSYKCAQIPVTEPATTESIRRTGELNDNEYELVVNQKPANICRADGIGLLHSSEEQ